MIQTGFLRSRLTQDPTNLKLTCLIQDYHLLRFTFPDNSYMSFNSISWSYYPNNAVTSLVWAVPVSLTTTPGIIIIFSSYRYLDVSVPCVRPNFASVIRLLRIGFPHSDSHGSIRMCQSPWIFAACHVLLRLQEPRHPPCTLINFSITLLVCT